MYFESMSAALAMDGHGPFVWSAYTITLVVVAGLLVSPTRRIRATRRQIQAELRREQSAMSGGEHAS